MAQICPPLPATPSSTPRHGFGPIPHALSRAPSLLMLLWTSELPLGTLVVGPLICGGWQIFVAPTAGRLENCTFHKGWHWEKSPALEQDRPGFHSFPFSLRNQAPMSPFIILAKLVSLAEEWQSLSPALQGHCEN